MSKWKETINLYHLIQRKCDKPAYFWCNWNKQKGGCTALIYAGYGGGLKDAIEKGILNPQKFCDEGLT